MKDVLETILFEQEDGWNLLQNECKKFVVGGELIVKFGWKESWNAWVLGVFKVPELIVEIITLIQRRTTTSSDVIAWLRDNEKVTENEFRVESKN